MTRATIPAEGRRRLGFCAHANCGAHAIGRVLLLIPRVGGRDNPRDCTQISQGVEVCSVHFAEEASAPLGHLTQATRNLVERPEHDPAPPDFSRAYLQLVSPEDAS